MGGRGSSSKRKSTNDSPFASEEANSWFEGSKVVDENNRPLVVYHGSVEDFDTFDLNKIRHDETDANYNGFWFTSDKSEASPAWTNPKYVKDYYLSLKNPAPISVANKVYKEIYSNEKYVMPKGLSYADATRLELQKRGYDGVIHQDAPKIDWKAFDKKGEYTYTTNRDTKYQIVNNKEDGGIDFNRITKYGRVENVTGYLDKADFIEQNSSKVFVIFSPSQIRSVSKIPKKRGLNK